jgi:hypothetical protein
MKTHIKHSSTLRYSLIQTIQNHIKNKIKNKAMVRNNYLELNKVMLVCLVNKTLE